MSANKTVSRRRLRVCLAMVVGVFSVFGVRLFQIQGLDASAYAAKAIEDGTAKSTVPAPRGAILDRNGAELATSVDGLTLTADPKMTAAYAPQIARILREEVGSRIDYFDTIDKLRTPDSRFVYLIRDVPAWTAKKALTAIAKANLTGVFSEKETLRTYPGGKLAANLLGYVNGAGKGVAGIEQQYDMTLAGTDGASTYEVDPNTGVRIPMADSTVTKMVPGGSVKTTIDRDLQWYADQRLADAVKQSSSDWGLAITMDTKTCQIVQMSQAPTFNADAGTGMDDSNTVSRGVQNVYEPGSVMKTVTMAALADQGKIASDTPIVVPSGMDIDNFHIGDYWEHGVLHLTAAGVIAKSSNLGTIVASQQMSDSVMYDYFHKFGFGQKTGVNLPGESKGILTNGKKWTKANHATIAFGQGISVTALQMVRADGAIANAGKMCEPSVVTSTTKDGTETKIPAKPSKRVVSKDAAATVTRMMEAVTAPDGTAPAAAIKGYRVAGKTGTAWRVDPKTGRYIHGQNTVSFMGFAPADNPRFLTYIVLDKPYSSAGGGSTAAPVFHDIMSMALERFGVAPTGSKSPKVAQTW